MSESQKIVKQLSFRMGLTLLVLGALIYLGGGSKTLGVTSLSDAWLGAIVGLVGVLLLGLHLFLKR